MLLPRQTADGPRFNASLLRLLALRLIDIPEVSRRRNRVLGPIL